MVVKRILFRDTYICTSDVLYGIQYLRINLLAKMVGRRKHFLNWKDCLSINLDFNVYPIDL